jgi:translocation and assembly module TamB
MHSARGPTTRLRPSVRGALAVVLIILLALTLLACCALAAAWWWAGREDALQWAVARAVAASGGKLAIEGARGSLRGEVELERAAYADARVRLEARGVRLRPDWLRALTFAVGLEYLRADSVAIELPPDGGGQAKPPASFGLPLRLAIQRADIGLVALTRGAARYELRDLGFAYAGGPLSHRVEDLKASLAWEDRSAALALSASVGAIAPFGVDASLDADLAQPAVRLRSRFSGPLEHLGLVADAQLAGARARLEATLAPFSPRRLESMRLDATGVDLAVLAPIILPAQAPALAHTALTIEVRGAPRGERFAGSVTASNAAAGPFDRDRVPVAALQSRFDTDLSTARLSELRIGFAGGGALAGEGELAPRGARLALNAKDLSLRSFFSTLRETRLAGPLALELQAERQSLRGALEQSEIGLALDVSRAGERVDIRSLRARAHGGEASGSGVATLGKTPAFEGSITLSRFDPAQFGDYPQGSLNGSAALSGRWGRPVRTLSARWTLSGSELLGEALASAGRATFALEPRGARTALRIGDADAQASFGQARVEARGAFGAAGDSLSWKLDVPRLERLPAAWIAPGKTDAARELGGSVRAEGTLAGGFDDWRVAFAAQGSEVRAPGSVSAKSMSAKGSAGRGRNDAFEVALDARSVQLPGYALTRLSARSTGTMARHDIRIAAANGILDLDARLEGSVQTGQMPAAPASAPSSTPSTAWSGRLLALSNRGEYPLELTAPTPLELSAARVHVGRLEAKLGAGRLLVREASWEPGKLASSGEFTELPAVWLLAPAGLATTKPTLRLAGEWSLESTPRLNGRITLRRTGGDIFIEAAGTDLGLTSASIDARFTQGALAAQAALDSRVARLLATAETTPEPGAAGLGFTPSSPLRLEARIEIAEVRPLFASLQTQGRVSGRAGAVLRAGGTLGKPVLSGNISADALGYDLPPWGMYLRDGRLRAELRGDTLEVSELSVRGGEGRFTASGVLPMRLAEGGTRLAWQAENFTLLNRPDMRLALRGRGTTSFDGKRFGLQGELAAERGEFEVSENRLPALAGDIVIVRQGETPDARRPKGRVRLPLDLDLQADLGPNFALRAWGFTGRLAGRLHVTTDVRGEPRAEGRIEAVNATFQAYGQRLQVQEGTVIFNGPIDNPALQVTAWRRNQPVEAGVQITGTVRDPRVQLVSEPPVPEGERLSWLVLGHAPGAAGSADLGLLQAAAGALFGRRNSPSPTQRIASAFGLDELTVRSSSSLPSQVVAVGKRLSDRLYISYEQAVGVTAASLVKLDFSLSRRLSLRAEAGTSSGVGVVYRYAWE